MIRCYAFNLRIDPVRTKITDTQHIPISQVCDSDERGSKEIIADKNLLKVCSKDKSESEIVIVNESSMEDIKSESVHKIINTNKGKY